MTVGGESYLFYSNGDVVTWMLRGGLMLGRAEKITVLSSCLATKKQDLPCYSTRF